MVRREAAEMAVKIRHFDLKIVGVPRNEKRVPVAPDPPAEEPKTTARQIGNAILPSRQPIKGPEIRRMRERAHLSQAAFARHLNLTTGYISQLERGTKTAKGPVLALLNVIRRKGFEALE